VSYLATRRADAVTGADWRPGRIIDDAVFFNKYSMTVSQIQAFLNAKVPVCAKNHTDYSPTYPGPYTCLKDYQENIDTGESNVGRYNPDGSPYQVPGGKTAAQIIWDAAQAYTINPQTLIVMLQKEQSLVTDDWPLILQYQRAMGQSCPDTAPCDPAFAGFYNQVSGAAWQIRHYINHPDWFNYKSGVTRYVLYNPNSACGGTNVYIENSATAALYNYTPYQPNAGALSNLYGTANCGAYGNRNFWRLFNDWFGSTIGPDYAWELLDVSYSTGGPTFAANQPGTVIVTVRNTGRLPWYNSGDNPVNLATWSSPGHHSPLVSPGWLSPNTPANMNESQVDPGGTATFTVPINVSQIGTVVDGWNLIVQNSQWMEWQGLSPTIDIVPAYAWRLDSVTYSDGTGMMIPKTQQLVTVKATNTGAATWNQSSEPPVQLATWGPGRVSAVRPSSAPKNWLSSSAVTSMNQTSVAPGEQADFQFYVEVPSSGYFYERFNLVAQGQQWFNDQGLTLYLKGATYSWQPISTPYNTGATNVTRGQTATMTINVRNTGDITWYNTSPSPIDIATNKPQSRGSILYNSSWLSGSTPARLQQSSVAPNQIGTFIFSVTIAPNAATGVWNEHFNLVAQGLTWLNDPQFYLYFNVQ
jgi:hypothetical protein